MNKKYTQQLKDFIVEFHRLYGSRDRTLVLSIILAIRLVSQRKGLQFSGKWQNLPDYIVMAKSELPEFKIILESQVEFLRGEGVWQQGLSQAIHLSHSLDLLVIDSAEVGWMILDLISRDDANEYLYFIHQRQIAELAVDWVDQGSKDEAYCPFHGSFSFAYAFAAKGIPSVFTAGEGGAVAFAHLMSLFVEGRIEVKRVFEISEHLGEYDADITFTQGIISPPWGLNIPFEKLPATSIELKHKPARSESIFTQYMMSKVTGRCVVMVSPSMLHRTTGGDRSFKAELVKSGMLAAIVQFSDGVVSAAPSVAPTMLLIDPNIQQQTLMIDASGDDFYKKEGRSNHFVGKCALLEAMTTEDPVISKRITAIEAEANDWNLDVHRYVLSDDAQRLQEKLETLPTVPLHEIVDFVRCQAVKNEAFGDIYLEANQADINNIGFFNRPQKQLIIADAKIMSRVTRQRMLPGDVLLTTKGNVGKVGLVPDSAEENWIAGQSFIILRLKAGGAIQESSYLYRYLNSPIAQHALQGKAIGNVIKTIKMNDLEELPVAIPTPSQVEEAVQKQQQMISLQEQVTQLQQQIIALRSDSWLKI